MLKTIRRLSIHLLRQRTSGVVLAALSGGAVTMAVGAAVTMAAEPPRSSTDTYLQPVYDPYIPTSSSDPFRRPEQLSVPIPSAATSLISPKGAGIQPLHIEQRGVMDGPGIDINPNPDKLGDPISGQRVYRYETLGNEVFWTDVMRLVDGFKAAKVTPMDGLRAGFLYNTERIEPGLLAKIIAEAKTDLSPENAPTLNDPATFIRLLEMNAVNGMPAVDVDGDGRIDLAKGDKVGVACSICHAVTDASILELPDGGSIGKQIDGPSALVMDMGQFLAWAANSKAYYPNLQVVMPGGKTIGRAPKGLTPDSSEEEFDAYLLNKEYYPRGTFDETQDGIGNSVVNMPLFRQDLAAPWASSAEFRFLDNISNGSFTQNLDPTTLLTEAGRHFLEEEAKHLGLALRANYQAIIDKTGVKGYPFVKGTKSGKGGPEYAQTGIRVDNQLLFDLNAYMHSLPAPKGAKVDEAAFRRGREVFRANCTACHNVDQSKPVPPLIVSLEDLWPDYKPQVIFERNPPYSPVQNSPGTFDDKMVISDGSQRGDPRGVPIPLLFDLARKKVFLHDASVHGLDSLFNPERGAREPHPYYIADAQGRSDLIEFIRGLDENTK